MKWFNRVLLGVLLFAVPALGTNPSDPEQWDATYETNPAASDNVSQGDDWMRQMKLETRRRMEVEHQMGSGAGPATDQGDNGAHRLGSARCFVSSTAPTALVDSTELHDNTSPGNGSGTLSAVETGGEGGANDLAIGHGRCWFDTSTGTFYLYDDVDAGAATNWGWRAVGVAATSVNLIQNGSFSEEGIQALATEAAAGTDSFSDDGSSGSCRDDPTTTEDTTAAANDYEDTGCARIGAPLGWAETGTPTDYTIVQVTDEAAAVQQAFGIGNYFLEISGDGANEGITQTLTGLQESSTYVAFAQVLSDGSNTCAMDVTGEATTNLPDSSTASTPDYLAGFFTTDASATDVVLQLRNTSAATYDCHWTNVAVFPVRPSGDVPLRGYVYQFIDKYTNNSTTLGPTREVIWGGAHCYHRISAQWTNNGADEYHLQVNVNGGGAADLIHDAGAINNSAGDMGSGVWIVTQDTFLQAPDYDATEAGSITVAPGAGVAYSLLDDGNNTNLFSCTAGTGSESMCFINVEQICN